MTKFIELTEYPNSKIGLDAENISTIKRRMLTKDSVLEITEIRFYQGISHMRWVNPRHFLEVTETILQIINLINSTSTINPIQTPTTLKLQDDTTLIRKIFNNAFKAKEECEFIYKNKVGKNVLNLKNVVSTFGENIKGKDISHEKALTNNKDDRLKFMKALGFEFSSSTIGSKFLNEIINVNKSHITYGKDVLGYIFTALQQLDCRGVEITEPIFQLGISLPASNEHEEFKGEYNNIKLIINAEINAINTYD